MSESTTMIDNRPEWLRCPEAAQSKTSATDAEYFEARVINHFYDEFMNGSKFEAIAYLGEVNNDGAWDCSGSYIALAAAVKKAENL